MTYKHHIVPRHRIRNWFRRGIIDEVTRQFLLESVVEVTLDEHIAIHRYWYDVFGSQFDLLATRTLSGLVGKEELCVELARANGLENGFQKGHKLTTEQQSKISKSLLGNKRAKGMTYKHTSNAKQAIREKHLGRVFTEEWKQNISDARVGKGTGSKNAMSNPENRKKVGLSKLGRKIVVGDDGIRRLSPRIFT